MDELALELIPLRRIRGAALIAVAGLLTAAATLVYARPQLLPVPSAPPAPRQVLVLAASFDGPSSGWIAVRDATHVNGATEFYRTTDAGRHWAPLPLRLDKGVAPLLQFFDVSHGVLMVLRNEDSRRPHLYVTDSGGAAWRSAVLPVESVAAPPTASFSDAETGWFLVAQTGGRSQLWRTRDGAGTWQPLPLPPMMGGRASLHFLSAATGLLAAGAVWATSDGGDSWRRVVDSVPIASNIGRGVAEGAELRVPVTWPGGGAVLASNDAGATWSPVRLPAAAQQPAVALMTTTDWYLAAGTQLSVTHDGGASWVSFAPRLPHGAVLGPMTLVASAGWSVGATGPEASTLLRTTNGGASWSAVKLPNQG